MAVIAGFIPAIHVLRIFQQGRRGWPGQASHDENKTLQL
jgi:hypothetical protein